MHVLNAQNQPFVKLRRQDTSVNVHKVTPAIQNRLDVSQLVNVHTVIQIARTVPNV